MPIPGNFAHSLANQPETRLAARHMLFLDVRSDPVANLAG